jgi:hypothetical protein
MLLLIVTTLCGWEPSVLLMTSYKYLKKIKGLKGRFKGIRQVGLVRLFEPFFVLVRQCGEQIPEKEFSESPQKRMEVVEENLRPLRFLFKNNEFIMLNYWLGQVRARLG